MSSFALMHIIIGRWIPITAMVQLAIIFFEVIKIVDIVYVIDFLQ